MEEPSTTPTGAARSASLPGAQDRDRRAEATMAASSQPPPASFEAAGDAERVAKQGAAQIGREVHDLRESARRGASDAAGRVKDAAGQTARDVKQQAGNLASQLTEKGSALVDQQKSWAADLIGDCVAATRRAAQKLHDENDHNLAGYADAFAGGLESTGRYLREQDTRRLVDDAADLARRRPEWVLGGAFVVGLAVARFLKASRPEGAGFGTYRRDVPDEYGGVRAGGYGAGERAGERAGGAGNYGADYGASARAGGAGEYGGGYGASYGAGYGPGYGGQAREYGSPVKSPSSALAQPSGDAGTSYGSAPGAALTAGTPAVTTTATESWRALGTGENPPADPSDSTGTTPSPSTDPDPVWRNDPEAP